MPKRRRIISNLISSSESEDDPVPVPYQKPSASQSDNNVPLSEPSGDVELDEEILQLLGEDPEEDKSFGKPIHKDLADRWQDILDKGLAKELKNKLLQEYLIPSNCDLLAPPAINPEIKAAIADSLIKRDTALFEKQRQLGIAIAALSQCAELIIAKESAPKVLKPLSDACRLLCDSHNAETKTRRNFVISAINAEMKDALVDTKRGRLLFGDNISEKVKSAKTIKRSGADLKQVRNDKFNKNNFVMKNTRNSRLNWKTTPRRNPGTAVTKRQTDRSHPARRPVARGYNSQQRDHSPATKRSRRR